MIKAKRVYDPPEAGDGERILVERLWPRGMKKEDLQMQAWMKEVAPSTELRKWFSHDPSKWEEFQQRYFEELDQKPQLWGAILEAAKKGEVTLLYSARDTEHNNAQALASYLMIKQL